MRDIKVTYDGKYPNACSGRLTVVVDGDTWFDDEHCCTSTGSAWFGGAGEEHLDAGQLVWDCAYEFPQDVQEAVRCELSKVDVCCGGCL